MNTIKELLFYKGIMISDAREADKFNSPPFKEIIRDDFVDCLLPSLAIPRRDQFKTVIKHLSPNHTAIVRLIRKPIKERNQR